MRIAVLLFLCAVTVFALAGCEYFEEKASEPGINPRDPRTAAIGGVITSSVDALNGLGIEAFYDFVSLQVNQRCTVEEVGADLADLFPKPARLRQMNEIVYPSENVAKVNVTVITLQGDVDQDWTLYLQPNGIWRILRMPGLDECAPAEDPV